MLDQEHVYTSLMTILQSSNEKLFYVILCQVHAYIERQRELNARKQRYST
jgi:ribosomal protein S26